MISIKQKKILAFPYKRGKMKMRRARMLRRIAKALEICAKISLAR